MQPLFLLINLEFYSEIALSRKPFGIGHMYLYNLFPRMAHTMTSKNTDPSSWDTLHRKRFFLFLIQFWSIRLISQFYDHFTDGRTPWKGDQLITTPLPKHRINAYTHQTSMPYVGFEPTIAASEWAKTVHALDSSVTVTSRLRLIKQ
jgi:hypothetical protein